MNPEIPILTKPREYSSLFTKRHTRGRLSIYSLHFYRERLRIARKARKRAILAMKKHNESVGFSRMLGGHIVDAMAETIATSWYHDIMYGTKIK